MTMGDAVEKLLQAIDEAAGFGSDPDPEALVAHVRSMATRLEAKP